MKQRKNIALFMGMLETEFSRSVYEGALLAATEIDANLFVFPGGIINAKYADQDFALYRRQYNILYSYASAYPFDAIVLEYGTILSLLNEEEKKDFLKRMGDTPVVLLAGQMDGYSSVGINNKTGMSEAVEHLIEQHQCKKIGFVSGPKTNQDAKERLQAYYETMDQYGLEVLPGWVTYADFSEFCDAEIEVLVKNNPDLEAIVFANDQMACAGYRVLKKHGLKPGEDIFITAYDNSPLAMLLEPPLSSVKIDPKELAYRAVMEIPKVIAGREIHVSVNSRFVARESCGCSEAQIVKKTVDSMLKNMQEDGILQFADSMFERYYSIYFNNREKINVRKIVEDYVDYYFHMVQKDGTLVMDDKEFIVRYHKFMQTCQQGYVDLKDFLLMDQILYEYLCTKITKDEDKLHLLEMIIVGKNEVISNVRTKSIISIEKEKGFEPILASVASDMLVCTADERKSYATVISKLKKMDFASSCILTYENGIEMKFAELQDIPRQLYVKAYHCGDDVVLYKENEKVVNLSNMFEACYIPKEYRFDMLVIPLFSNSIQHGIMLIEAEVETFHYAVQIASQISVAIDVIEIMNKQNEIKEALERNLEKTVANNKLLDEMCHVDPLTDILNRRGFLESVKSIVSDKENYGKRAMAMYADMDNLKIVNDEFGHDEGDYALKAIANALADSFAQNGVIARMGGDEFAAFALIDGENFAEDIKRRISQALAVTNEHNDKPYYVNISMGTEELIIDDSVVLEHVLSNADRNLYHEKKGKKKVIYKTDKK